MNSVIKCKVNILISIAILALVSCNSQPKPTSESKTSTPSETGIKVTFIELGSVRCIPCQRMQPVMKSIEQKYGKQVRVVFHDVWTEAGSPYAKQYGVEAIPTQIFLDETGKEYFRHEGFFAEEELIKVLKQKGVR